MKTQKVEIELPALYGYEFDGYRKPNDSECEKLYVYFQDDEGCDFFAPANCKVLNEKKSYFFYKKKKPRRIIYEEVREDYLKQGDAYLDDSGCVNEWIYKEQSRDKKLILKKIHDDFEVNNG